MTEALTPGSAPRRPSAEQVAAIGAARAALVVIDMQNDYCHPDGACNTSRDTFPFWSPDGIGEMMPVLQQTIRDAREAGVPVVWIRSEYSGWIMTKRWEERGAGRPLRICRPGSWGIELHEGFEPEEGEPVIVKPRYSAFVGTQFELAMRVQGIDTLIVTGVTTNVCIETTARDAFMRDFRVVVPSDCSATYAQNVHDMSLWNIGTHFGTVMTAAELVQAWSGATAGSGVAS